MKSNMVRPNSYLVILLGFIRSDIHTFYIIQGRYIIKTTGLLFILTIKEGNSHIFIARQQEDIFYIREGNSRNFNIMNRSNFMNRRIFITAVKAWHFLY